MTDQKKETVWITIPDEEKETPVLTALMKTSKRVPSDKVQNKAFWSVGFVALIVFVSLLFAPQEFAGLMKGQLFDGGYKVVPENAAEQAGSLFGGTKTDTTTTTTETTTGTTGTATGATASSTSTQGTATTSGTQNENVVQAESEPVSIQVEPLTDTNAGAQTGTTTTTTTTGTNGTTTTTGTGTTGTGTTGTGAGTSTTIGTGTGTTTTTGTGVGTGTGNGTTTTTTTVGTGTGTGTGAESQTAGLDANAQLLQALSQQVEDFKAKQQQSDQQIQDLMQLLADQAGGLHGAATTQTGSLPQGQITGEIGQTGALATAQIGAGTGAGAGVYRYNTHTVTVSPYDVLAKNQGLQSQQAAYQANVANGGIQAYSAQSYNPALAGVHGQPGTGPAETLLFALMLASFGILIWGIIRSVRA